MDIDAGTDAGTELRYALEVMERLGLPEGTLRIGAVHYNTAEEVDRLLAALADLA